MNAARAKNWEDRDPDILLVASDLCDGLIYGVKQHADRRGAELFVAGAEGKCGLTRKQAIALFYELGDVLVNNLGVMP